MAGQASSPSDNAEGEVFRDRDTGNEPVLGIFDNEDSEVNTGRKPRELHPN